MVRPSKCLISTYVTKCYVKDQNQGLNSAPLTVTVVPFAAMVSPSKGVVSSISARYFSRKSTVGMFQERSMSFGLAGAEEDSLGFVQQQEVRKTATSRENAREKCFMDVVS